MRNLSRAISASEAESAGARAIALAFCLLCLALGASSPAAGANGVIPAHGTAIVIIADGLEPELIDWSQPKSNVGHASSALISSRTVAGSDPASYALTAGAGTPMTVQEVDVAFGRMGDEYGADTVGSAYLRRSGRDLAAQGLPEGAVAAPAWFELVSENAASPYRGVPGFIGESLRQSALTAAIIYPKGVPAEAAPGEPSLAFLLAADAGGIVGWAATGPRLSVGDPQAPMGWRTDAEAVGHSVRQALRDPRVALVAIDYGDVARALDETNAVAQELRSDRLAQAYRNLDAVIESVLVAAAEAEAAAEADTADTAAEAAADADAAGAPRREVRLFVLSLRNADGYGMLLAVHGGGVKGLLTSATTRREGLLALVDVAPTVLDAIGAAHAWDVVGFPAEEVGPQRPPGGDWAALIRLKADIVAQERSRPAVLSTFTGSLVVAVLLCLAALVHPHRPGVLLDVATVALVASCVSPVVLILAPIAGIRGAAALIALMLAVSLSAGVLSLWRGVRAGLPGRAGRTGHGALTLTRMVEAWATAWAVLILGDAASGGTLARSSVLGHSAIVGARFYGIGNELMGVLLGAMIVAASALWRRCGRAHASRWGWMLLAGAAAAAAVVLGSPSYGSNFGGMLAASAAAAAAVWLGATRRRAARLVGLIAAAAIVAALAWANLRSGNTHIARALPLVQSAAGRGELIAIAQRKLAMNIKLMRYTSWAKLLWALLASALFLAGGGPRLPHEHRLAVLAAIAGALGALVANDSGVVACATAAMAPAFLLIANAVDAARSGAGRGEHGGDDGEWSAESWETRA